MLTHVHPKLPMRDKAATRDYYIRQLGFEEVGDIAVAGYLMLRKDYIELHFFAFPTLDPTQNYGMVYIRVQDIDAWYDSLTQAGVLIHPNSPLEEKHWGQKEFSLLDPDNNLLTFGAPV